MFSSVHNILRCEKRLYKYFILFFSGRNFIRSKEFQEAQAMGLNPDLAAEQPISTKEKQRSIRHKLVSLTLKRKNKMGDEIKKKLQEEEYTADSYNSWLESRYVQYIHISISILLMF